MKRERLGMEPFADGVAEGQDQQKRGNIEKDSKVSSRARNPNRRQAQLGHPIQSHTDVHTAQPMSLCFARDDRRQITFDVFLG